METKEGYVRKMVEDKGSEMDVGERREQKREKIKKDRKESRE